MVPENWYPMEISENLLKDLEKVRWHIARNTYGSSHCTLIGLLVDWWISGNPQARYTLEGGPSFVPRSRSEGGGGQCDAILVQDGTSRGVVEVEGGFLSGARELERYLTTIDKIGKYFAAGYPDLQSLEFGIFLAYPTRKEYMVDSLPMEEFVRRGLAVTTEHSRKQLVILTLDKKWDPQRSGPRARGNIYYQASPYQITGALLKNGEVIARNHFML